jgi:hypothetical protein
LPIRRCGRLIDHRGFDWRGIQNDRGDRTKETEDIEVGIEGRFLNAFRIPPTARNMRRLISLCSKITGKFDPSMGAMVAFARDEALTNALDLRS